MRLHVNFDLMIVVRVLFSSIRKEQDDLKIDRTKNWKECKDVAFERLGMMCA